MYQDSITNLTIRRHLYTNVCIHQSLFTDLDTRFAFKAADRFWYNQHLWTNFRLVYVFNKFLYICMHIHVRFCSSLREPVYALNPFDIFQNFCFVCV